MNAICLFRKPVVGERMGLKPPGVQRQVEVGLLPPPVGIGSRAVAWISTEIDAVQQARIAGASNSQIRELVQRLIAQRPTLPTADLPR